MNCEKTLVALQSVSILKKKLNAAQTTINRQQIHRTLLRTVFSLLASDLLN